MSEVVVGERPFRRQRGRPPKAAKIRSTSGSRAGAKRKYPKRHAAMKKEPTEDDDDVLKKEEKHDPSYVDDPVDAESEPSTSSDSETESKSKPKKRRATLRTNKRQKMVPTNNNVHPHVGSAVGNTQGIASSTHAIVDGAKLSSATVASAPAAACSGAAAPAVAPASSGAPVAAPASFGAPAAASGSSGVAVAASGSSGVAVAAAAAVAAAVAADSVSAKSDTVGGGSSVVHEIVHVERQMLQKSRDDFIKACGDVAGMSRHVCNFLRFWSSIPDRTPWLIFSNGTERTEEGPVFGNQQDNTGLSPIPIRGIRSANGGGTLDQCIVYPFNVILRMIWVLKMGDKNKGPGFQLGEKDGGNRAIALMFAAWAFDWYHTGTRRSFAASGEFGQEGNIANHHPEIKSVADFYAGFGVDDPDFPFLYNVNVKQGEASMVLDFLPEPLAGMDVRKYLLKKSDLDLIARHPDFVSWRSKKKIQKRPESQYFAKSFTAYSDCLCRAVYYGGAERTVMNDASSVLSVFFSNGPPDVYVGFRARIALFADLCRARESDIHRKPQHGKEKTNPKSPPLDLIKFLRIPNQVVHGSTIAAASPSDGVAPLASGPTRRSRGRPIGSKNNRPQPGVFSDAPMLKTERFLSPHHHGGASLHDASFAEALVSAKAEPVGGFVDQDGSSLFVDGVPTGSNPVLIQALSKQALPKQKAKGIDCGKHGFATVHSPYQNAASTHPFAVKTEPGLRVNGATTDDAFLIPNSDNPDRLSLFSNSADHTHVDAKHEREPQILTLVAWFSIHYHPTEDHWSEFRSHPESGGQCAGSDGVSYRHYYWSFPNNYEVHEARTKVTQIDATHYLFEVIGERKDLPNDDSLLEKLKRHSLPDEKSGGISDSHLFVGDRSCRFRCALVCLEGTIPIMPKYSWVRLENGSKYLRAILPERRLRRHDVKAYVQAFHQQSGPEKPPMFASAGTSAELAIPLSPIALDFGPISPSGNQSFLSTTASTMSSSVSATAKHAVPASAAASAVAPASTLTFPFESACAAGATNHGNNINDVSDTFLRADGADETLPKVKQEPTS